MTTTNAMKALNSPISFISRVQESIRMQADPNAGGGASPAGGTQGGQPPAGGTPGAGQMGGAGQTAAAGGAPAYDWGTAGLDTESLGFVQTKGYKTPADLVGAYRGAEKLLGVPADQVIKLPQGEFNQQVFNETVANRLGRPTNAADYKLPVPPGGNPAEGAEAAQWFHDLGLTTRQAQALAEKYNGKMQQTQQQLAQTNAAEDTRQVAALKGEWGQNFDKNTAIVDRAAEAFGMKAEQIAGLKKAMGAKAAMEFLHNIGTRLPTDDSWVNGTGQRTGFTGGMSVDQARARKTELQTNKGWVTKFNSGDTDARAEMSRLNQILSPGTVTI